MPSSAEVIVAQIGIKINGSNLDTAIMEKLEYVIVETSLALPSMFVLRFHDDQVALTDNTLFTPGAAVIVQMMDESRQLKDLITGEITAIEPDFDNYSASLTVRGYDKRHRLNYGTFTRTFVNSTDSDIVRKIASESGLSVRVGSTTVVHEHVFQDNQTNLAFIQDRAVRNGFGVYMDGVTLVFDKFTQGAEVALEWGVNLLSFSPRMSIMGQVNEVSVQGWDVKQKRQITGLATTSSSHPQIGYGKSGGQAVQAALQAYKTTELRRSTANQSEAEKIAQGILDSANASFVQAEGQAFGNPALIAGAKARLTNIGTRFGGTYVVSFTRHIYEAGGYTTEFRVEGYQPQMLGDLLQSTNSAPALWTGVAIALVTNNNDPDGMGRVKLKYPWLSDQLESGWARIAMMGAGNERGFQWLPEVNDEVLVAFEHGDMNRPFVIGSLYNGMDKPPQSDAHDSGKIERRTLKTRAGHIIRLTDKAGEEKIEIIDAKQKTQITMDTANEKITIKSTKDILIEGTSSSITLKSKDITLDATGKIVIKGTTGVEMSSSAMMEIKASASLKIQGAMTEIKGTPIKLN